MGDGTQRFPRFKEGATDTIFIEGLRVFGHHGVHDSERSQGQDYLIDIECRLDTTKASASDSLEDTVDYAAVIESVNQIVGNKSFYLLETLGETLAAHVLVNSRVESVKVAISKPALSGHHLKAVGVVVERSRYQAGDRPDQ